jgi:hypothetical protein
MREPEKIGTYCYSARFAMRSKNAICGASTLRYAYEGQLSKAKQ